METQLKQEVFDPITNTWCPADGSGKPLKPTSPVDALSTQRMARRLIYSAGLPEAAMPICLRLLEAEIRIAALMARVETLESRQHSAPISPIHEYRAGK